MRKWLPYVAALLWLLGIAAAAFSDNLSWKERAKQAVYQDGYIYNDTYYFTENMENGGVLYLADAKGRVHSLALAGNIKKGSYYGGLAYSDALYAVLMWENTGDEQHVLAGTQYQIVEYDMQGSLTGKTQAFTVEEEGELTGFCVEEDGFYLTFILDKGKTAGVYQLDREALSYESVQDEDMTPDVLKLVQLQLCEDGRLFAEADYENGELQIWRDNGNGKSSFEPSKQLVSAFDNRKISIVQIMKIRQDRMLLYVQILCIGYAVLVLLTVLLKNRNHMVYTIVIVEAVLFVITLAGALLIPGIQEKARQQEAQRFGFYYVQSLAEELEGLSDEAFSTEDYYEKEEYYELRNRLSRFVSRNEMADVFSDICLVRIQDGVILASASDHNGCTLEQIYGRNAQKVLVAVADGEERAEAECYINGYGYRIFGTFVADSQKPDYMLIGISGKALNENVKSYFSGYIFYVEIIFFIASAVSILLLLLQNRELKQLALMMRAVAGGQTDICKKASHGKDVDGMWNSLLEINRSINRMNYSKYCILESCYRFAPKSIEKILNKNSITEVAAGDMVQVQGTVVVISSTEPHGKNEVLTDMMNRFMTKVEKNQELGEGFFISGQSNLSKLRILFLNEKRDTTAFGISLLQDLSEEKCLDGLNTCIFLHYSQYLYGVAGTQKQCFPFLLSKEMEELELYAGWFQRMNVKMIMTEAVKNREVQHGPLRYLGYIQMPHGDNLKIYEVLDACSGNERRMKLDSNDKFQHGLELLYQHDFYLARSVFSELLKENPQDLIVKWYVFTCEKYLNETSVGDDVCLLKRDERFTESK